MQRVKASMDLHEIYHSRLTPFHDQTRTLRSRKSILSFAHWRNRLIFWCGAIVVGVIAAGFAFVADYAQKAFAGLVALNQFLPLIFCPLILGITGWLTFTLTPSAAGSGIPQAIAAPHPKILRRRNLLGPKVILGKILFRRWAFWGRVDRARRADRAGRRGHPNLGAL